MAEISSVGIVGSGIMATGVAEVVARAGHHVVVRSRTSAGADALIAELADSLDRQVEAKITPDERDALVRRVTSTDRIGHLAECDLIIESVVEDLAIDRAGFV